MFKYSESYPLDEGGHDNRIKHDKVVVIKDVKSY